MDRGTSVLYFWKMTSDRFHPVRINSAGLSHCAPDWSWDSSLVPWFDDDLWYVAAGRGRLETPDGVFNLSRGDGFVLRGGQRYRGSQDPQNPLTVYFIHFSATGGLPGLHHRLADPDFFEGLLGRVLDLWHRGEVSAAQRWLEAVFWELGESPAGETSSGGAGRETGVSEDLRLRLLGLCGEVQHHPERPHQVQRWARDLGLSRQHFCRVFQSVVGRTPRTFLAQVRIETARMLLRHSDHPLKRVARLCGFRDEFYFSRAFHRQVGMSPGKYKRLTKEELGG